MRITFLNIVGIPIMVRRHVSSKTVWWPLWHDVWITIEKHSHLGSLGLWSQLNSLRPSDAIWLHRSGSILAQVMACCLMAPSHCLNQFWLMITEVLQHSPDSNFTENTWYLSLKWVWILLIWDCSQIPRANELRDTKSESCANIIIMISSIVELL